MKNKFSNNSILKDRKQIANTIFELTFKSESKLVFKPGQYISIIIDDKIRRQYSISNFNNRNFQIIYDVKPNGVGVNYLNNLEIGDEILFIGPIGNFFLKDDEKNDVYFIGTGTGIAPLKSMIDELITQKDQDNNIHLIFGTRYEESIIYEDIFSAYLKDNLIKEYKIYLSGDKDIPGKYHRGRVTSYFSDEKIKQFQQPAEFYLCGSSNMINEVSDIIKSQNNKHNIYYEEYY